MIQANETARVLAPSLPARLSRFQPAYGKIRQPLWRFLQVYSRRPHVFLPSARVVPAVLEQTVPELRRRLGDKLLAVALGGSISRGLGTPRSSDIDFSLYVHGADRKTVQACEEFVCWHLKSRVLRPCDASSSYDLALPREYHAQVIISLFTNYFIFVRQQTDLRLLARQYAGKVISRGWQVARLLAQELGEVYPDLSGTQECYVVKKYLANIAGSYLRADEREMLANSKMFVQFLERLARPYVEHRRMVAMPFPAELGI